MNEFSESYFLDWDGSLIWHQNLGVEIQITEPPILLPGVRDFVDSLVSKEATIIITTGRPEKYREATIQQLVDLNIPFHHLIMSLGRGKRFIVNDKKHNSLLDTCAAINLTRNRGFGGVIDL